VPVKKTSDVKQTSNNKAATVKHASSKVKVAKSSQQKPKQVGKNEGAAVTPCQAYTVMVEAAEFDDALLDYSDEELDASIEQPPLTIEGEDE